MSNHRWQVVTTTVILAAVTAVGGAVAGVEGGAVPGPASIGDSPAHLRWERPLPQQDPQVLVAMAPGGSSIVASDSKTGDLTMNLRRLGPSGKAKWSSSWDAPGLGIKYVRATAVAVGRSANRFYVGGTSACKVNDTGLDVLGPAFVRSYSLSGHLQWTHWTGRCPAESGERPPRPMRVTGLDARSGALAVSLDKSRSCCGEFDSKGHLRLYSSSGQLRWSSRVSVASLGRPDLSVTGVAIARHVVVGVGTVERTPRDRQAVMTAVRRLDGAPAWQRVLEGPGTRDYDGYSAVSASHRSIAAVGLFRLDTKRPATALVQSWQPDGSRVWSREDPNWESVQALPHHRAISVGSREHLVVRRYASDGSLRWHFRWGGSEIELSSFDASSRGGEAASFVERGHYVVKVARWRW